MPEMPEVETIAAGLRARIAGRVIGRVRVLWPKLLRTTTLADLRSLEGTAVTGIRRRGKILVLECGPRTLLFHLKMTGQFLWVGRETSVETHIRLIFAFADTDEELRFRDVRKFGFLRCLKAEDVDLCDEIQLLGPEPLEISRSAFEARLAGRRGRLKSLLLNQRFLAGIGNIYADEALFAARVHPRTAAGRLRPEERRKLWLAMRAVLRRTVAAGGSSVRDYRGVGGELGDFQTRHRVYGRNGEPCVLCRSSIRRIVLGGRSTFFCPRCQRLPR
jgi:formamidopyrimidine-DNA glycosylase